ncbi:hypothetical protein NDU88_003878 [Pleurodeles waltl]|uniref:Secreted protein n=1 Tax=Pleurodeles waltl TaxID=8319 RepID=A0AAV7NHZ6_PLEWA|nr:hypothetical protein NDU88_003878 [Pleurodeles waltl]
MVNLGSRLGLIPCFAAGLTAGPTGQKPWRSHGEVLVTLRRGVKEQRAATGVAVNVANRSSRPGAASSCCHWTHRSAQRLQRSAGDASRTMRITQENECCTLSRKCGQLWGSELRLLALSPLLGAGSLPRRRIYLPFTRPPIPACSHQSFHLLRVGEAPLPPDQASKVCIVLQIHFHLRPTSWREMNHQTPRKVAKMLQKPRRME